MAATASMKVAIPFQTQDQPNEAATGFLQYYAYMISMVDQHILRVLETLEETGLREETLLVFASDHGEFGASHSKMMEKWHSAYQEIVHVPVLVSSPKINHHLHKPKSIKQPTSHVDLLPTLLGLANISPEQQSQIKSQLAMNHYVTEFPGKDLSPLLTDKLNGNQEKLKDFDNRPLLFVTDDMITEPLPIDDDPHNDESWQQYAVFNNIVEKLRKQQQFSHLSSGPVQQPAHVRAVRWGDWKLIKYSDPWSLIPVDNQWELYNLASDGNEVCNLLVFDAKEFPTVIEKPPLELNMTREEIKQKARALNTQLSRLELENLSPYPSAHPSLAN